MFSFEIHQHFGTWKVVSKTSDILTKDKPVSVLSVFADKVDSIL